MKEWEGAGSRWGCQCHKDGVGDGVFMCHCACHDVDYYSRLLQSLGSVQLRHNCSELIKTDKLKHGYTPLCTTSFICTPIVIMWMQRTKSEDNLCKHLSGDFVCCASLFTLGWGVWYTDVCSVFYSILWHVHLRTLFLR